MQAAAPSPVPTPMPTPILEQCHLPPTVTRFQTGHFYNIVTGLCKLNAMWREPVADDRAPNAYQQRKFSPRTTSPGTNIVTG